MFTSETTRGFLFKLLCLYKMIKYLNNDWILGFIEAEGTISSKKIFTITQHIADYKLMEQIRSYLRITN